MSMPTRNLFLVGALVLGALLPTAVPTAAAGEKAAVFGGDLTPPQRDELAQLFGVDPSTRIETVGTPELANALQETGIPVVEDDKAISSAGLTCLDRGQGLNVQTRNITRMTPAIYANALVTAGVGDANILVAAPAANPVTGETALVGVLKAFPQCQAGKQPEPARVALAYEQLAQTVAVAGPDGDLGKASAALLEAAQPVVTGQARDEAAIGGALDRALASQGVSVSPEKRGELIAYLQKVGGVDYGAYAKGYEVQGLSATEARVVPAGAGAPGNAGGGAAEAAKPGAGQQGTGGQFNGEVTAAGQPLTVGTDGGERQVTPGPNVVVTRDGRSATLGDIRPSDRVGVALNPDGTAQRIDARSVEAAGNDRLAWLVPLLALVPIFGALFWLLAKDRRRRGDYILERRVVRTAPASRTVTTTGPVRGTETAIRTVSSRGPLVTVDDRDDDRDVVRRD